MRNYLHAFILIIPCELLNILYYFLNFKLIILLNTVFFFILTHFNFSNSIYSIQINSMIKNKANYQYIKEKSILFLKKI